MTDDPKIESTDDAHICADSAWIKDVDAPATVHEHGDVTCSKCGERLLLEVCNCGHLFREHQTGEGPWTGFCGGNDAECECVWPTP